MTNDVIPMPPDPHGLGVAAAWHPGSSVSLGTQASGLLSKAFESVQQRGVTDQFTTALVSNATGHRTDETVDSLTQTGQAEVDAALTAVNRAHGVSVEAQNVLNTKGGIAAQTAEMEADFTALQAEFATKSATPQNQAEYESRYQALKAKHGSEIQSLGANGKATTESVIPQITAGGKPQVPASMNPNVEGAPSIPTMPDGLLGQALQMVGGVAKMPGQLPIPQLGQFAQQGAQLTQAMISEMAKQAKSGDSGEGSGLEATGGASGVPVTPAALSALNQAQKDLDSKATLSKPDGKGESDSKKDEAAGSGRGAGAGKAAGGPSSMPAAPAPDSGNAAAASGGSGEAKTEGAQVHAAGPEVSVPNTPGVSEVTPAGSSGHGGAPTTVASAEPGAPASSGSGGHTTLSGSDSTAGGGTTLSAAHTPGDGSTSLSGTAGAGGGTTLSGGDAGGGPAATATPAGPAAGGGMAGGGGMGGMAPMMGAMGGGQHGGAGAGSGRREGIVDPSAGKAGAHRRRVSVTVAGVSGDDVLPGLADSGFDLVGLEHATPQQYQAAGVVASLVRSHSRAGVLTEVAAGVCEDGRVVFATSDGLGFITPGVRVPFGAVPLVSLVPERFVESWLGCAQPWRALQAAEVQGFVDRFVAVASSDPDSERSGVLAVSEEQMRAMNLPPAQVPWFEVDAPSGPVSEGDVAALIDRLVAVWDPPGSVSAARLESAVWSSRWTGEVDRGYAPLWVAYLVAAARTDLAAGVVDSARYLAGCADRVPSRSLRPSVGVA